MANVLVKKNEGGLMSQAGMPSWDPFRMMREMFRWDPFREIMPSWPYWPVGEERTWTFMPAFEVKETKDSYVFKADVPGVQDKDLEITLTGNRLTVSGKREAEVQDKTDTYFTYERSFGSFTRTFTLPDGADTENLHADLKDGVLTLVLPKKPELQPRRIALKSGSTKS